MTGEQRRGPGRHRSLPEGRMMGGTGQISEGDQEVQTTSYKIK